jgi:hypothetical protein
MQSQTPYRKQGRQGKRPYSTSKDLKKENTTNGEDDKNISESKYGANSPLLAT